jgi:hypothetical protein
MKSQPGTDISEPTPKNPEANLEYLAMRTVIPVSPIFRPYVDAAVLRFTYLFPDIGIEVGEDSITATHSPKQDRVSVRRELTHSLYREKIYHETLSMRRDMVATLTRRS